MVLSYFKIKIPDDNTLKKLHIHREAHQEKMGTPRGFMLDLPMQPSVAQKNRGAPGIPQTHSFIHMGDYSMDMIPQDQVDQNFRTPDEHNGPRESSARPFINLDDSRMNLVPQNPAGLTPKRIKYLKINSTKEVKDLYNGNYKMLQK